MGISGTDRALMYALSGVERSGATRSGYTSPKAFVSVNGVQYGTGRPVDANKVMFESLNIIEVLNEVPNTATFTMKGAEPAEGQDVVITLGSMNNLDRAFAGVVLNRSHGYVDTPGNWHAPVNAVDYTWHLTRRLFSGLYTTAAPADVAAAIVAVCPGFTVQVEAGLATLDAISFTNQTALSALTQLAKRCGGYCDVDYHKVVKIFTTDTSITNPTTLTSAHVSLTEFSVRYDLSPVRTRVWSEGGGANALAAAAVGATAIGVEDAGWYNVAGGIVAAGQQRITYTGLGLGYTATVATWVAQTGPTSARDWVALAYAPALDLFVAVAQASTPQDIMTSSDGVTWTTRAAPVNSGWHGLAWAPSLNLFAAVSTGGLVMTSPDGITWTQRTAAAANAWEGICWSTTLSLFVAVSATGASRVMTSPDGINWTSRTAAAALQWESVVWSPTLNLFAAVADSGPNGCMTSPDGTTWTQRTTATSSWKSVTWSPSLAIFLAVGGAVGVGTVMTSPDGTTWTARTPVSGNTWQSVIWIPELLLFVAVSSDGAGDTKNRIMASTDGTTWSSYQEPSVGVWYAVAFSPTLAKMVAVGITTAATVQIMTNTSSLFRTLTGIPASGAGSILYAIKQGDPINLLVQCDAAAAQTALAALIGGGDDGIVEDYIQDHRISETEARARGVARLAQVSTTQVTINYKVRDKNTHAGSTITASLGSPTSVSAAFKIQHVTVDTFQPALMPTYTVEASSDRFSLDDLLRLVRQGLT